MSYTPIFLNLSFKTFGFQKKKLKKKRFGIRVANILRQTAIKKYLKQNSKCWIRQDCSNNTESQVPSTLAFFSFHLLALRFFVFLFFDWCKQFLKQLFKSIHPPTHVGTWLSFNYFRLHSNSSFYLSIYLSVYLSSYLSIYLSVYFFLSLLPWPILLQTIISTAALT